jgi:putative membrane-bound dehydrogenase-like protein
MIRRSQGACLALRTAFVSLALGVAARSAAESPRLQVLFLGDNGHHTPADRFLDIQPALEASGINLTYTDRLADLSPELLGRYDCLVIYANFTQIQPAEEAALLEYVAAGKGFVPIHCASYCFLNSPRYVELVGAQFQRHGTGVFRTIIAEPDHPVMRGFNGFESWDETYVHTRHNEAGRTVLEYRLEGDSREPWTWVRSHGKGRVFYTAWGHDGRTWNHSGFHNLIERGIRWAAGANPGAVPPYDDQPQMTRLPDDLKPFRYTEANVPYYPAGRPWGTVGEPFRTMQLPLEPAESLRHMVAPAGFEVRLFAAEPDIQKPICMSWDERGRLWIAETIDYPNDLQPEGEGNDRLKICEDTDGDGRADRFTVFADKLSIPTSIAFANGGVIVHQAPHTLFLRDLDGDGVADERRVLFSGWSTADTHAGPSNLNYGFDNWLWGIVGYSGFQGEAGGERHSFRTGFYRFKPDGSKLEFLRNTNNNSWGVGFGEDGIAFGSTANGNPSVYLPIPNRYYEAVRGWSSSVLGGIAGNPRFAPITDKVRQVDYHGAFTAAAGHALYTARTYPRQYWNRAAFVTEPTGHLIATFLIERSGADFRSRIAWNLLASDDEWTAPIMAEVGPDGHVWVIDWYNYIVQHNPTPSGFRTGKGNAYVTDLRDKRHGRILRVVYTGAAPAPPMTLAGAGPAELVAALRHDNLFWRRHAQRLLVERGKKDVVLELCELARDRSTDEIGLNPGAIHALWTLHGLGALEGSEAAPLAAAVAALDHPSPAVRRNAILVLPRSAESIRVLLDAGVPSDADGQVRLAAFLALSEMPRSREAAGAVAAALEEPRNLRDRWLLDALTCAAAAHDLETLEALAAKPRTAEPPGALTTLVERVAEHFARGAPRESVGPLLAAVPAAPGGRPLAPALVSGLARGWPEGAPLPPDAANDALLLRLLAELPAAARGQLVRLAARWGSRALKKQAAEIAASFLETASKEDESDRQRLTAARELISLLRGDAEPARSLLDLITPQTGPELAGGLIEAVARSEAAAVGELLVERLPSLTPAVRPAALRALLGRGEWTRSLLAGLESGDVQAGELSLDQKQALSSHPDPTIAAAARKLLASAGGLPSPDRQEVLEELLPLAEKTGDPARGKEVFLKQCAKCHVHGSEGSRIGPDLTGMAVHPKVELLTQIIDPSRSVEGNYRAYTVVTQDGRVLSGLLVSESRTALELFDAEAQKHAIQRQDVLQLVASTKSLMPEGFEKQISADEMVDLLEFLAHRGKFLPLPLDKAATATSTRGMFNSRESRAERLIFPDWSQRTFEGVPFQLVDPQGDRTPNVVLLHGPQGTIPPRMPRSVRLPCNAPARSIHLLSGVSGWGFPLGEKGSVSLIVRLHFEDGTSEEHPLRNGEHFADYIRHVDVPGSKLAYRFRGGQQIRYLAVQPTKQAVIREIELEKGADATAPLVLAVTLETP